MKTGVIVNQASAQGEGKLSVLIAVAEQVGNALSGVNAEGNITGVIRPKVEASPVRNQVGLRLYAALGGGTQETSYGDTAYYYDPTGFGVYGLFGLWKNLCLTADVSYLSSVGDSGAATTSADVGVAYAFPVGRLFPWAGLKLGYMIMEWPDLSDYAETGLEYAFDVGMDPNGKRFSGRSPLPDAVGSIFEVVGVFGSLHRPAFILVDGRFPILAPKRTAPKLTLSGLPCNGRLFVIRRNRKRRAPR